MEKLINVDNNWDGEVQCLEVMGLVSFRKKMLQQQLCKGLEILKAASWSYWCGE